jgi:hypothetical protein
MGDLSTVGEHFDGSVDGGNDQSSLLSPKQPSSDGGEKRVPRKRSRLGGGVSNKTAEVWKYFNQIPPSEQTGQSARCLSLIRYEILSPF